MMDVDVFLPYQSSAMADEDLEDYYKEGEYEEALVTEDEKGASVVHNAVNAYTNDYVSTMRGYRGLDGKTYKLEDYKVLKKTKTLFAKAKCRLFAPNGGAPETIDSIVDKFATGKEFGLTMRFMESTMDAEFEEDISKWYKETKNLMQYHPKMIKNKGRQYADDWLDKNIPRRKMRMTFINKSNIPINCELDDCEIFERPTKNDYVIYVKKLQILR